MGKNGMTGFAFALALVGASSLSGAGAAYAEPPPKPMAAAATGFSVDGQVALASMLALGDGYLKKFADSLELFAGRAEAIAGDWDQMKAPLTQLAEANVPSVVWFALPSGEYYTLKEDRVGANLKNRKYFPRLMAGQPVMGELVVSRSTTQNVAIVAVPVFNKRKVVGALGASIYLDALSARIRREMALSSDLIFFSVDATPLLALVWDPGLIFVEPKQLSPEVEQAFKEMLSKPEGVVNYTFRGNPRTVLYKKSAVTQWWYGLGRVHSDLAAGVAPKP